jgi:cyclohexanecarboxyl-CoA dehydrogenase
LDESRQPTSAQREAFGQPDRAFQGVSHPFADSTPRARALIAAGAAALLPRRCGCSDAGPPHTAEAGDVQVARARRRRYDVIHQCLLTHGHYGWSLDRGRIGAAPAATCMGLEIGDGTAQIMKTIVARDRRAGKLRPLQHDLNTTQTRTRRQDMEFDAGTADGRAARADARQRRLA